jgi:hypothetical protein
MVVHTCNPRYSRIRNKEDPSSRPVWAKKSEIPKTFITKINIIPTSIAYELKLKTAVTDGMNVCITISWFWDVTQKRHG